MLQKVPLPSVTNLYLKVFFNHSAEAWMQGCWEGQICSVQNKPWEGGHWSIWRGTRCAIQWISLNLKIKSLMSLVRTLQVHNEWITAWDTASDLGFSHKGLTRLENDPAQHRRNTISLQKVRIMNYWNWWKCLAG